MRKRKSDYMLGRPESLNYFFGSKNVQDWIISRQPSKFEEALRGHTPDIQTGHAEDDDMVQTATSF